MDYVQVMAMLPEILLDWLTDSFLEEIPSEMTTAEDMDNAAKLMLKLSSSYSYLCALLSYAKFETRNVKRCGDKEDYEDMVDKKEAIQNILDAVKQQYNAISRVVTIRIENNRELQMNTNGYIARRDQP